MIIVFGAINMDMNMRVKDFPRPGETILSPSYDMSPGGKGANQALAAARGGVKTALVGKVGDDAMATRILNNFRHSLWRNWEPTRNRHKLWRNHSPMSRCSGRFRGGITSS